MSNFKRAEEFSRYVALELKGRIIAQGFTAKAVASGINRPAATLNRWLNNKLPLPLAVLCEAAEFIGVSPSDIVSLAYDRLSVRHGELGGEGYDSEDHSYVDDEIAQLEAADADRESSAEVIVGRFGQNAGNENDDDIPADVEEAWAGRFAAHPKGNEPEDHTP